MITLKYVRFQKKIFCLKWKLLYGRNDILSLIVLGVCLFFRPVALVL